MLVPRLSFALILSLCLSRSISAQLPSLPPTAAAPSQATLPLHKETVVVTGTAQPLPLDESDRSVDVVTPPNTLLLGSFANLLQLDSSVDLQQRAPGVQGDISIRGAGFAETLVLLNGMRINDAQSGHHNFDIPVPLDAISQVEVLHGTGSTLYGSDAVGGVVNVLTRVADPAELVFRGSVGSFGTNTQSGFFSFSHSALSQQFSFERELSDGFEDDREYRNSSLSSDTLWLSPLGATHLFLSALDRPFGANGFYGDYTSWERTKTWYAALQQDFGKDTFVGLSFRRHTDLFELFRDNPLLDANRHADEIWDAVLRRHNDLSSLVRLSYGAEGTGDRVQSSNLGDHHRTQGAAYGVLDLRSIKRFSLSLGAREEVFGHRQTFFAPTVSGGAWLSSTLKLRGAVGRAFRRPTYTDLYYEDPADLGNPNLKPEEATNYEGGVDWHFHPHWVASATVFDRDEKNGIDYIRASPADPWQAANFDHLRFVGLETGLDAQLSRAQKISLSYTAIHGSQDLLHGDQSKYAFNYPVNEAIASWQILSAAGVVARARFGVLNRYGQNPYALLDLYLGWTRFRLRPYLQLTNVTNTAYQEIIGVDMPGRAALVGLEVSAWRRSK